MTIILKAGESIYMNGCDEESHNKIREIVKSQGNRVSGEYGLYGEHGDCLYLHLDGDTDLAWEYQVGETSYRWKEFIEANTGKETKRPEDEVTIATTYGELARAYYLLGKTNGKVIGTKSLFVKIEELIDDGGSVYNSLRRHDSTPTIDYLRTQEEWLSALFPQESEKQKQIREIKRTIEELKKQVEELENS